MHAKTLIALAVQQLERKSVRGLAERLEVSHALVSDWQRGEKPMPDERIRQLAKLAQQDPGPWLLLIKSEQDEGDLGREWAKLAKKLAATTLAVLCAIGLAIGGPAKASQDKAFSEALASQLPANAYYVNSGVACPGGLDRPAFRRHPVAIIDGNDRGVYGQQQAVHG